MYVRADKWNYRIGNYIVNAIDEIIQSKEKKMLQIMNKAKKTYQLWPQQQ